MKTWIVVGLAAVLVIGLLAGCSGTADQATTKEQDQVARQQSAYLKAQPPPFFDWSLPRDLWVQFYRASNQQVSTWSVIQPITGGKPILAPFASQGYPIPMGTQLTNPQQAIGSFSAPAVVQQAEPNGLFSTTNNGTIVMKQNADGTLTPIYTEQNVSCFPFPVRWDDAQQMLVPVDGGTSTIRLKIKR